MPKMSAFQLTLCVHHMIKVVPAPLASLDTFFQTELATWLTLFVNHQPKPVLVPLAIPDTSWLMEPVLLSVSLPVFTFTMQNAALRNWLNCKQQLLSLETLMIYNEIVKNSTLSKIRSYL